MSLQGSPVGFSLSSEHHLHDGMIEFRSSNNLALERDSLDDRQGQLSWINQLKASLEPAFGMQVLLRYGLLSSRFHILAIVRNGLLELLDHAGHRGPCKLQLLLELLVFVAGLSRGQQHRQTPKHRSVPAKSFLS